MPKGTIILEATIFFIYLYCSTATALSDYVWSSIIEIFTRLCILKVLQLRDLQPEGNAGGGGGGEMTWEHETQNQKL